MCWCNIQLAFYSLVLSSTGGTYHFLRDDSLQSAAKDQQQRSAEAEKPHDAAVSVYTYQNLQDIAAFCFRDIAGFLFMTPPLFHPNSANQP